MVLLSFSQARRLISVVALVCILCFVARAVPVCEILDHFHGFAQVPECARAPLMPPPPPPLPPSSA
eukprot:945339-Prymnesium_polylepis.1